MEKLADLHIHSTASDGALSPVEVVKTAAGLGLAAVSITDHDTVDGIDEALNAGDDFGVEVVPGIEISTVYSGKVEAHILGYFIDHHNPRFLHQLDVLKNARMERGMRMVEQLNSIGIKISFERVREIAGSGAIGRPHVARAMVEARVVGSMDSAFGKYLQEGCPGYVERYKVSPEEAVDMIIAAGGVPVCAHVGKLKRDELLVALIERGMRGIEVFHPDHLSAARRFYGRFAERRGLIATGGSDAHCFVGGRHPGIGEVAVSYQVVQQLRDAAGEIRRG